MLILALIFITLSILILPIAWRGRVVARGQFCRKCRFDLAGLDIDSADSKCPECGRGVCQSAERRATIRSRSTTGMIVVLILLMGGISVLGISSSGKAGLILGYLPDSTIFWLNDLGMDEALDELVVRISMQPTPFSDELLKRAIVAGLAHQADTTQAWDPRWGAVLITLFGDPVMSDKQRTEFITNGIEFHAEIRERVSRGDKDVDVKLSATSERMSSLSIHNTGYWVFIKPRKAGVVGESEQIYFPNAGLGTNFVVTNNGATFPQWSGNITPIDNGFDVEPGTTVPVYIEYELKFSSSTIAIPMRAQQSVLVLARDKGIVPTFVDPVMAQLFCESILVSTVRVLEEIPEPMMSRGFFVVALRTKFDSLPAALALETHIRFNNGELFELGSWVNGGPSSPAGGGIVVWPMGMFISENHAHVLELTERLLAAGRVDVIFKTNAALADRTPGIERVLDVSLVFNDVIVESVKKKFDLQKNPKGPVEWFSGVCED